MEMQKILVVEDDGATRYYVSQILRDNGFAVLEATTGDEAIRVAEKNLESIDLIVCDVVLPQTIGTLVAKRLRALRPELKILFISGLTDASTYGLSKTDFLTKPFNAPDLMQKVQEILQNQQNTDAV